MLFLKEAVNSQKMFVRFSEIKVTKEKVQYQTDNLNESNNKYSDDFISKQQKKEK